MKCVIYASQVCRNAVQEKVYASKLHLHFRHAITSVSVSITRKMNSRAAMMLQGCLPMPLRWSALDPNSAVQMTNSECRSCGRTRRFQKQACCKLKRHTKKPHRHVCEREEALFKRTNKEKPTLEEEKSYPPSRSGWLDMGLNSGLQETHCHQLQSLQDKQVNALLLWEDLWHYSSSLWIQQSPFQCCWSPGCGRLQLGCWWSSLSLLCLGPDS